MPRAASICFARRAASVSAPTSGFGVRTSTGGGGVVLPPLHAAARLAASATTGPDRRALISKSRNSFRRRERQIDPVRLAADRERHACGRRRRRLHRPPAADPALPCFVDLHRDPPVGGVRTPDRD